VSHSEGLSNPVVSSVAAGSSALYAGTSGGGVFRGGDGGWSPANNGLTDLFVRTLAVSPRTATSPEIVLAGTSRGSIFRSTDSGDSWSQVGSGLIVVSDFAVHPADPLIVYAGTVRGVFWSLDAGLTWSLLGNIGQVFSLAVGHDPANTTQPTTLYAGSSNGLFRRSGGGLFGVFVPINTGMLAGSDVLSLSVSAGSPATLYAGTAGAGVFKSINDGDTWEDVNTGLTATEVTDLAVHRGTNTTYAAIRGGGVFKTDDGGGTWTPLNDGLSAGGSPALAIASSDILFATADRGVFKSSNGGASWSLAAGLPGATALDVGSGFLPDPTSAGFTVLAGTGAAGVFRSTDGGTTWEATNDGLGDLRILSLTAFGSTVYASTVGGLFRSGDWGTGWAAAGSLPGFPRQVVVDPTTPSTIYVSAGGVKKSTNRGASWADTDFFAIDIRSLAIDPADPLTLYAGTIGGVFRTRDGGALWEPLFEGMSNPFPSPPIISALVVDSATPTPTVYAGTVGRGVFRRSDPDEAWQPTETTFDRDGDGIPDRQDVEGIQDAVAALPADAFGHVPGIRRAVISVMEDVEAHIIGGEFAAAITKLENLRRRLDGCGATPDVNDWIVQCASQLSVRALVDELIANLQ
jgi:photosystem II stability/assembly factor-like uncharacterized protein